mmetsp:Transcript_21534/g.53235  ORF Transcript_21534/g.53235 Transcript_21534/m.53235 type:complete len:644 (+) Transcript_21534:240-2171(+)
MGNAMPKETMDNMPVDEIAFQRKPRDDSPQVDQVNQAKEPAVDEQQADDEADEKKMPAEPRPNEQENQGNPYSPGDTTVSIEAGTPETNNTKSSGDGSPSSMADDEADGMKMPAEPRANEHNNQGNPYSPGDTTVSIEAGTPETNNTKSSGDGTVSMGENGGEEPSPDNKKMPARPKHKVNAKSLTDVAFSSSEDNDDGDESSGDDRRGKTRGAKRKRNASRVLEQDFASSDDDCSDGSNSVYQLQKVCMQTNEVGVGSLVCVVMEKKTGKRKTKKQLGLWGKIVGKHSEEVFDVQCKGKVLPNVSIEDMLTLESPQLKDDKLTSGDIVYAAWPGTDPTNDLCFWGRINEEMVAASSGDSKKHYSVVFFPTPDSHGLVDVTDDLESEFIYRKKEAIYLMESSEILGTVELPSSHRMSLKELIGKRKEQQEASEEKQKGTTKKKAKASKTRKPSAARKPKCAAAAASSKPRKRRKTAAKKSEGEDQLQDPSSYQLLKGDVVYAPFPNEDPANEVWYCGYVDSDAKTKGKDVVIDVRFSDGCQSLGVKLENLYKLESQEYKDSVLKVKDRVYAPYPGKKPEKEPYHWGRITKAFKSDEGENVYRIRFHDGDTTKQIDSSHFHRYAECIHMMGKGWVTNDKPPKTL